MSHGRKTASANLEEQTLHLTVRLQAGEEEEQEEEHDEEIGGLINSDGEVVEWDASKCFMTGYGIARNFLSSSCFIVTLLFNLSIRDYLVKNILNGRDCWLFDRHSFFP